MDSSETAKGHCNACDGHIAFPASVAGQSISCPHCGKSTLLTPVSDEASASASEAAPASPLAAVPQVSVTPEVYVDPQPKKAADQNRKPTDQDGGKSTGGKRISVVGLAHAAANAAKKARQAVAGLTQKAGETTQGTAGVPARFKRLLKPIGIIALIVVAVWLVRYQPWKPQFERTRMWAERGNAEAQFELAMMYSHGEGVAKDQAAALEWGAKAAEAGQVDAQVILGRNYAYGNGVKLDYKTAYHWFKLAADQEDDEARSMIGEMHYRGLGCEKSSTEAKAWFLKSDEHPNSQFFLGILHFEGDGTTRDVKEAIRWFKKSAEQDHPEAQSALGYIYATDDSGNKDGDKAVEWLTKASEAGNADATCYLGWCHVDGVGVRKNQRKGMELVEQAADRGSEAAQNWLRKQGQQQMATLLGGALGLGFGSGDGGIGTSGEMDWGAQNTADDRARGRYSK